MITSRELPLKREEKSSEAFKNWQSNNAQYWWVLFSCRALISDEHQTQQTPPALTPNNFCHLGVLRTLSTSDDVEDRENEKGRLEEAYEKCDRDLDELIVQHYTELTTAIRTYQSITERITNSRNKIKQVGAIPERFCVCISSTGSAPAANPLFLSAGGFTSDRSSKLLFSAFVSPSVFPASCHCSELN